MFSNVLLRSMLVWTPRKMVADWLSSQRVARRRGDLLGCLMRVSFPRGVVHLYCHLTQPLDPQCCHDFQSMSRSSSHLHSNISLMFRYIIFQFAFNIFSCGINYIIHHIHSYYILYQSNYIIHHITSSYYNLPTFPQISTVFWALPLLPTIPRPSPEIPRGLGGEALPAAPRGPGPALRGVRDAAADGGAVSTGRDHPGLQRLGDGWTQSRDNVYLCIFDIDLR